MSKVVGDLCISFSPTCLNIRAALCELGREENMQPTEYRIPPTNETSE